ncbi:glycosyltransferase [Pseudogracilibacillus auburnensis]|uniref:glycosyltransferase n=1 Tax=Pseudogracilibacillus auburnensis TaxID=1494959 RepID=UPI001A96EB04|nr:glycosyltransferase [Pseudogracilibacillus auburnensis]MBO1005557.1 glycosyltransferase [Pseudogracilibacillus auburnensis]
MDSKVIQEGWLKELSSKKGELLINLLNDTKYLKESGMQLDFDDKEVYELVQPEDYKMLKEHFSDAQFIDKVLDSLEEIPESNGTEYFNKIDVNIGIIADEFLFNSFKDVANFYYIDPNNYKVLDIDVLIVATAWRGINNSWHGLGNPKIRDIRKKLDEVISFYRANGVKIVFYSKEDPTNYNIFIDIAKKCDYIFTTASEKVEDYKRECNNENVYVLEFGVNPIYNNPIGLNMDNKIKNGAIFAGSWYEKYPHRKKDTRTIFDGVISSGGQLKIIDRNFDYDYPKQFLFPFEYLQYISPSIDHETLQKVYKLFPWTINLNSVQTSETMFANRVYELQAMGNLILSNYSVGINNLFPNIFMVQNSNEVKYIMNNLSEKELYMHKMFGVRKVLKEHTTFHRMDYLLNKIGYNKSFIPNKKVAVVVNDLKDNRNIENFNRQTFENKQLVLVDNLLEGYDSFDYVTYFHSDYEYGEYYLEDLVNGFKYTNCSYVTKDAFYNGSEYVAGIEHNYVNEIKDKYKTVFSTKKFQANKIVEIDGPFQCDNGYSIDCLEININPKNIIMASEELKLSVIIPVYNNGDHLYGKCFLSLLRSSMFKQMDIIFVDDGSTDEATKKMVDRLDRLYSNVQVYKFNDGGSGSASRPRNKGILLAKTEYITYLDPDNEAINDGYYHLYNEMQKDKNLDVVVGNIVKFDKVERLFDYADLVRSLNSSGIVTNTYELLKGTNLRVQSIQALITKKDVILKNNIKMIEKQAGQDTLYFQELLLKSSKMKVINVDIHIYYAAVFNSVTNTIGKGFFKKYLKISQIRYDFLKKHRLLEQYLTDRFPSYFIGWFLVRVPRIPENEVKESLMVLNEIYRIYKDELETKPEPLLMFEKYINEEDYTGFVIYCKEYFNYKQ